MVSKTLHVITFVFNFFFQNPKKRNFLCFFFALLHTFSRTMLAARRPLLAVPNVTAHPSTASVPITVLLYICVDLRF